MKSFFVTIPALLAALVSAAPVEEYERRAIPTIYMAGDSTMALGGAAGTSGWGPFLPFSIKDAQVVNRAIGGRSARSSTNEGDFESIINMVGAGDYVIMEFGNNDGGSLRPTDNNRTACGGSGSETCTTANGVVVQTYVTYLTNAAKALIGKGAKVIICSPIPRNPCQGVDSDCQYTPSRFTAYGQQAVQNAGSGASFIDHGLYVAREYKRLGKAKVDEFYPVDHLHTSPAGATVVAQSFVKAVLCGNGVLAPYIKNSTSSIPGNCA